jgi:hypothetical protein
MQGKVDCEELERLVYLASNVEALPDAWTMDQIQAFVVEMRTCGENALRRLGYTDKDIEDALFTQSEKAAIVGDDAQPYSDARKAAILRLVPRPSQR